MRLLPGDDLAGEEGACARGVEGEEEGEGEDCVLVSLLAGIGMVGDLGEGGGEVEEEAPGELRAVGEGEEEGEEGEEEGILRMAFGLRLTT